MKKLQHQFRSTFGLFNDRFCFQTAQAAENADENVDSVAVADEYKDEASAEAVLNQLTDKGEVRVKSFTKPRTDIADSKTQDQEIIRAKKAEAEVAIARGVLAGKMADAKRALREIESKPGPDQAKKRAAAIKDYQKTVSKYIGSPSQKEQELTLKNGETVKAIIVNKGVAVKNENGREVLTGNVVENEKDIGQVALQSLLNRIKNAHIPWTGKNYDYAASKDEQLLLNAVSKSLSGKRGFGQLAAVGAAENDPFIGQKVTQWLAEMEAKTAKKEASLIPGWEDGFDPAKDLWPFIGKIDQGVVELNKATDEFVGEVAAARGAVANFKTALGTDKPDLVGTYTLNDSDITLFHKKGFPAEKAAMESAAKTVFDERKKAATDKIAELQTILADPNNSNKGPEFETQRAALLAKVGGYGFLNSLNGADLTSLTGLSPTLKKAGEDIAVLATEVDKYVKTVNPSADAPTPNTPAGDAAGGTGGSGGSVATGGAETGGTKPAGATDTAKEVIPASITKKYLEKKRPQGYKKDFIPPEKIDKTVPKWMKTQAEKMLLEASKADVDQRGYYYLYPNSDQTRDPDITVRIMRPDGKKNLELRYYSKEEAENDAKKKPDAI